MYKEFDFFSLTTALIIFSKSQPDQNDNIYLRRKKNLFPITYYVHLFQEAIKECMDQIEVSICMSMSGMSFRPESQMEKPNSRQCVQESQQISHSGLANSSTTQLIVVPSGSTPSDSSHCSGGSKTVYLSSASTTPTDLMDVVTSASYVGAY